MEGLSIVICTYNGKERLLSCLQSIFVQKETDHLDLIVVDNASTDGTGSFCREYLKKHSPIDCWRVVDEPRPGLVHARIAGMRAAVYEWVLYCDDDNLLFPDFTEKCGIHLNSDNCLGVLGTQGVPEIRVGKPFWFDRYASSYAVGSQLPDGFRQDRLNYVYGACSIYRKRPLLDLLDDGFVPLMFGRRGKMMSAGDDVEWCWLMQLLGYRIAYVPELKFYHRLPVTRLTWQYYVSLKQGISDSAALLYVYHCYFLSSKKSEKGFSIGYRMEQLKAWMLYQKYCWKWEGTLHKPERQLAFSILEARCNSYRQYFRNSLNHYNQLKNYFGS